MNEDKESEAVMAAPFVAPGDPFGGPCDGRGFYADAAREKVLNLLLHLAPYSDLLLLTGGHGSGKTALCGRFAEHAPDDWRVFVIQGGPEVDETAVLDAMDRELAVRSNPDVEPAERLARLRRSLAVLRRGSLLPILVIDDAHRLPPSAFAFLAALTAPAEGGGERAVGVLLAGEAEGLEARLDGAGARALRPRIAHDAALSPLSEEDTADYVRHRLEAAGRAAEVGALFTPAVMRFIHTASEGNPGRINELARVVLHQRGPGAETEGVVDGTGRRVLLRYGALTLVVTAVFLGVLYREELSGGAGSPDPAAAIVGPAVQDRSADRADAPVMMSAIDVPGPAPGSVPGRVPGAASGAAPGAAAETAPEPVLEPILEPVPDAVDGATLAAGVRNGAAAPTEAAMETESPSPAGMASAAVTAPAIGPIGEGAAGSAPADQDAVGRPAPSLPETAQVAPQAEGARPGAMPAEAPRPAPIRPEADVPPETADGARGEAWLLAQEPGVYTLQLFASEEARILRFIEEHGLGERAATFLARAGERPLHAVIWGLFATRAEALDAAGNPPVAGIPGIEPWARSMGDIHRAIAAAGPVRHD